MTLLLSLSFIAWIVVSAFVQAADHPAKNVVSPGLTAYCGVLILGGALVNNVPMGIGLVLAAALLLLAGSDLVFERSTTRPDLFPLAMVLGVLSGLMIGITLNIVAFRGGLDWPFHLTALLVAALAAVLVYRRLKVTAELQAAVLVYLVQAVILLTGGLACLAAGHLELATWGILIFLSDSLVGLRAFPNPQRPIRWLTPQRILLAILTLYYSAQFALVTWAL